MPASVIVGIIGVETIYGRDMGTFRVLDSLSTLAFDYPDTPNREARSTLFRNQLADYLLWCRDTRTDVYSVLGSFAGAIGIPQFMPTSLREYAIDYDNNGRIDLRNSPTDAIGSVARFLHLHGWEPGARWCGALPATPAAWASPRRRPTASHGPRARSTS